MKAPRLLVGYLLLAGGSVALAQAPPQLKQTIVSPHGLTRREGIKIVDTALEQEERPGRKPDCSHLTNEVYSLAGYPYPYASSIDLYHGVGSFVRVIKPQPGDLIVWPGHVGIVVDPIGHSFYSSVTSGLRTEVYDAPSWKARGTPRYYRYAAAKPSKLDLTGSRPAKTRSDFPSAIPVPAAEGSPEISTDSEHATAKGPGFTYSEVASPESPSTRPTFQIPSSILVAASQAKPTQMEIAGAISELSSATGDILGEGNLSQLRRNLVIYDDLTLDRPQINGKHGSAQAQIESRAILIGGHVEQVRRHEKIRWDLLHSDDGWHVVAPKDTLYVPREVATRMLASRLASLTQDANSSDDDSLREQTQIVRVLSALLDRN